jgi:hypothetical protein
VPRFSARLGYSHLLANTGRFDEALASFEAACQSGAPWTPLALIGYPRAVSGQAAAARLVLGELTAARRSSYVPPYRTATVHAGLGDAAIALQWLERGVDERDVRMVFLQVDPTWSALQREPEFITLPRRMNLAPSGEAPGP